MKDIILLSVLILPEQGKYNSTIYNHHGYTHRVCRLLGPWNATKSSSIV